jgi:hypothetical protein
MLDYLIIYCVCYVVSTGVLRKFSTVGQSAVWRLAMVTNSCGKIYIIDNR